MNEMEARLKALEMAFKYAADGMPWASYIEVAEKLARFIIDGNTNSEGSNEEDSK